MTNPYYTRVFSPAPESANRSVPVKDEFNAIAAGFDLVDAVVSPNNTELVAARQGQASLTVNLGRYVSTFEPAAGDIDAGGFLLRNAGTPLLAGDLVNRAYVDNLVLSGVGPTLTGNAGKTLRTNGTIAEWGDACGQTTRLTVANNGLTLAIRTSYELDSSGGAFTVNLPTMAIDDWIELADATGSLSTNNVTIGRNGYLIRATAEDLLLDTNWDSLRLVKNSTGVIEK